MIKIIRVSIIFILMYTIIYSAQYSIGVSVLGVGPTIARGGSYNTYFSNKESKAKTSLTLSYTPAIEINSQVDIFKYFGFDFGIGFGVKSYGYTTDDNVSYIHRFHYLSLPILLRGQYDFFNKLNVYMLAGARFNFNVLSLSNVYNGSTLDKNMSTNISGSIYNIFTIDVSFAVGVEYKVAAAHYIGLRASYDLNAYSLYKIHYETFNNFPQYKPNDIYIDAIGFSLTYRYIFGIAKDKKNKQVGNENSDAIEDGEYPPNFQDLINDRTATTTEDADIDNVKETVSDDVKDNNTVGNKKIDDNKKSNIKR